MDGKVVPNSIPGHTLIAFYPDTGMVGHLARRICPPASCEDPWAEREQHAWVTLFCRRGRQNEMWRVHSLDSEYVLECPKCRREAVRISELWRRAAGGE